MVRSVRAYIFAAATNTLKKIAPEPTKGQEDAHGKNITAPQERGIVLACIVSEYFLVNNPPHSGGH